jgi:hypothetical protein
LCCIQYTDSVIHPSLYTYQILSPRKQSLIMFCRAILKLHLDSISHSANQTATCYSTLAIKSMLRQLMQMTKLSFSGVPMDLDGLSFSSHRMITVSALLWIDERFAQKDAEWEEGVEDCKIYLAYLAPRYELYSMYWKFLAVKNGDFTD